MLISLSIFIHASRNSEIMYTFSGRIITYSLSAHMYKRQQSYGIKL